MIILIKPTKEYEDELRAFIDEMIASGDTHINGSGAYEEYPTFEEWMKYLDSYKDRRTIKPGSDRVEGSQWVLVDDEKHRVLGMANIRHYLNDYLLREGGHIGYSIRPSERGQGYGHRQLELALGVLRKLGLTKALVTCDDDNVASYCTIESCGGVLENTVLIPGETKPVRRYWISLE
ncbi:MAG: GNAT family N-acetyltransferase [Bacilli bacterium]|jgi:predicted acetyltransferase